MNLSLEAQLKHNERRWSSTLLLKELRIQGLKSRSELASDVMQGYFTHELVSFLGFFQCTFQLLFKVLHSCTAESRRLLQLKECKFGEAC